MSDEEECRTRRKKARWIERKEEKKEEHGRGKKGMREKEEDESKFRAK